jgi:hypothetical protein
LRFTEGINLPQADQTYSAISTTTGPKKGRPHGGPCNPKRRKLKRAARRGTRGYPQRA